MVPPLTVGWRRCLACCEPHEAVACRRMSDAGDPMFCPPELLRELDAVADEMCDLDGFNTLDRHDLTLTRIMIRSKYCISSELFNDSKGGG